MSTPSTAFRQSLSSNGRHSPQWPNIASPLNGDRGDEVSVVHQVALRHRSARLSLLGGRKQEPERAQEEAQVNGGGGDTETKIEHSRSASKGTARRQSLFRTQSVEETPVETSAQSRRSSSVSRQSMDRSSVRSDKEFEAEGLGIVKRGSVRKRFSMLKLGKKSSKTGSAMRSVDEE